MPTPGDDEGASFRTPERRPRARMQPPAAPGRASGAPDCGSSPPPSPFSPMDVDSSHSTPRAPTHAATGKQFVSVFDWDDTLCPSFWLHRRGLLAAHGLVSGAPPSDSGLAWHLDTAGMGPMASSNPLSREDRCRLEQLEEQALALLQLASRFGPIFIITAATLQWVVASAEHFLPRIRRYLLHRQHHYTDGQQLQVVSAREWYHQHVAPVGDPLTWKLATFDALGAHLKVQDVHARLHQRTELLSVGDSRFEREACVRVEQRAPVCVRSKTLKFVDAPSLDELLDQLRMAHSVYERMYQYDGGLHLYVARRAEESKGEVNRQSCREGLGDKCGQYGPALQLVQTDRITVLHNSEAWRSAVAQQQEQSPLTYAAVELLRNSIDDGEDMLYSTVSSVRG